MLQHPTGRSGRVVKHPKHARMVEPGVEHRRRGAGRNPQFADPLPKPGLCGRRRFLVLRLGLSPGRRPRHPELVGRAADDQKVDIVDGLWRRPDVDDLHIGAECRPSPIASAIDFALPNRLS